MSIEINEEELLSQIQEEILEIAEELEYETLSEEQLDEISKRILGNYINRAVGDLQNNAEIGGQTHGRGEVTKKAQQYYDKADKRHRGIRRATKKLTKEEFEELIEKAFRGEGDEERKQEKQRDLERKKAREGKQKTRVMEAIDEMLAAAHENKPVEFAAAFNAAMKSHVAETINALRPEVAAGIFTASEE